MWWEKERHGGAQGGADTMETTPFDQLAKEHLPSLYTYCLAKTCDPHRAEELAQETLYRAYVSFHTLKDRQTFYPWLIGIAKRCSWTWFRKSRRDPLRQRVNETGADPPDTIVDTGSSPSEQLAAKERMTATFKAIKKLTFRSREVILLRYFEHLSYAEIARRLGVSADAVDQRLTRAKLKLKLLLEPMET